MKERGRIQIWVLNSKLTRHTKGTLILELFPKRDTIIVPVLGIEEYTVSTVELCVFCLICSICTSRVLFNSQEDKFSRAKKQLSC